MMPLLEQRNIDTLVIAPDGSLRLIPFAALHDREHFLIEKYAVGIIPSATLTELKPFEWEDAEILVGGLSQAVQEFSPLPNVPKEMKAVKTIMGGRVMFQDKDYTLENRLIQQLSTGRKGHSSSGESKIQLTILPGRHSDPVTRK